MPDVNKLSLRARRKSAVPPGRRRGLRTGTGGQRRCRSAAPSRRRQRQCWGAGGVARTEHPPGRAPHRSPPYRSRNKFRSLLSPLSAAPLVKAAPGEWNQTPRPITARSRDSPTGARYQPASAGTAVTGGGGEGPLPRFKEADCPPPCPLRRGGGRQGGRGGVSALPPVTNSYPERRRRKRNLLQTHSFSTRSPSSALPLY